MKRKTQAATAGKGKSSDEETEALLIEAEGEVRSLRKKLEDVQNRLMDYEDENEMLNRELKAKQRAIIELEDDVEELRRTNAGGDAREVGPATLRELRRQLREADDLALEKDRNARLTERELKKKIASKEREMIDLSMYLDP
jgi:chromosome segregation ATPase